MSPRWFHCSTKYVEKNTHPLHNDRSGLDISSSTEDKDRTIYKYSFCRTHVSFEIKKLNMRSIMHVWRGYPSLFGEEFGPLGRVIEHTDKGCLGTFIHEKKSLLRKRVTLTDPSITIEDLWDVSSIWIYIHENHPSPTGGCSFKWVRDIFYVLPPTPWPIHPYLNTAM